MDLITAWSQATRLGMSLSRVSSATTSLVLSGECIIRRLIVSTDKQEPCRYPTERLTRSTRLHHRHVSHPDLHGKPKCPAPRYSTSRNVRASLRRKGTSKRAIEPHCPTKHWATEPHPTSIHWRDYPAPKDRSRISTTSTKLSFSTRNDVELAIGTGWIRFHL